MDPNPESRKPEEAAHSAHLSNNCPHIMATTKRDGDSGWERERERESFPPSGAGEIVENGKYSASASVSVANKNVRTLERTQTHTPRAESFA